MTSTATTSSATTAATQKLDGKYRNVQVKLAANIQAKIDYRAGYYGQKQFAKFTGTEKEDQLQQALMLGDPMTDLSLSAELDYFRLARDRYFIPFSVKIPGAEIALAKKRGLDQTEFDFIGQVRDEHSKLVGRGARRHQNQTERSDRRAALLAADRLRHRLHLASRQIHTALPARENETGKMGTYRNQIHRSRSRARSAQRR